MNAPKQNTSTENSIPTQAELRVKVAELCGWKMVEAVYAYPPRKILDKLIVTFPKLLAVGYCEIPDFCNDLNACAEFEKGLSTDDQVKYQYILRDIVCGKPTTGCFSGWEAWKIFTATAEQRCRAFVKVMEGKSVGAGGQPACASGASSNKSSAFEEQQELQQQDFKET